MRFYAFDQFKIDVEQRLLLRAEEELHLIPRVFDVLLVLVRQPGQIVSKERLMEDVWGETIVEEGNLTEAISKLRRALGDDARAPRYIQNIPKQGYRFICEVTDAEAKPSLLTKEEEVTASPEVRDARPPRIRTSTLQTKARQIVLAAAVMIVTVGVLGAVWQYLHRQSPPGLLKGQRFTQLVNLPLRAGGGISQVHFSPDGKKIAYHLGDENGNHLWVKQIISDRLNQITDGAWRDLHPIWSSDGQSALVALMNETYLNFARAGRAATGGSCPDGWVPCPDNSCARSIEECSSNN